MHNAIKCFLQHYHSDVYTNQVTLFLQLDLVVLLIIICNLPQPTLKRQDILSEVRWAVFYAMLLVPVLAFTWLMPLFDVLNIPLPETFQYVNTILMCLQVNLLNVTRYMHSMCELQFACLFISQVLLLCDWIYYIIGLLQGFFIFMVYGLGQRSVRMAIMRKKYQPLAYPSRANSSLIGE